MGIMDPKKMQFELLKGELRGALAEMDTAEFNCDALERVSGTLRNALAIVDSSMKMMEAWNRAELMERSKNRKLLLGIAILRRLLAGKSIKAAREECGVGVANASVYSVRAIAVCFGLKGNPGSLYGVSFLMDGKYSPVRWVYGLSQENKQKWLDLLNEFESSKLTEESEKAEAWDAQVSTEREALARYGSMPVEDLGLSVRAYNCCQRWNIKTVEQLCTTGAVAFSRTKNLGKKTLSEIISALKEKGLRLGISRPVSTIVSGIEQ